MACVRGNVWIAILVIVYAIFLTTSLIVQLHQVFLVAFFNALLAAWIATLIVPYTRKSGLLQNVTTFCSLAILVWLGLFYAKVFPVTTSECGTSLCQGSVSTNAYFNPLSTRVSLGDKRQHRGLCPADACRWASDNGLPNLGYDRDIDGFLNYDSPNGPYASIRVEDMQGNLGRCFKDGFVEAVTLVSEFVFAPGVSTEIDLSSKTVGKGERICTHCSHYIYGAEGGCQSNGLEAICLLCPRPGYLDAFWLVWLCIWSILLLYTYTIEEETFPQCCERARKQKA
jgi:hypothetical protein